jgi:hypothetical protein
LANAPPQEMSTNKPAEELGKLLFKHRRNVFFWLSYAAQLKRAADLVYDAHLADRAEVAANAAPWELQILEVDSCATLLYGLSIENLAKAIRLRLKLHPTEDGKLV